MGEVCGSLIDKTHHQDVLPMPPPPPPQPTVHRRPKVREVSSRFMSPVVSSATLPSEVRLSTAKSPLPKQLQQHGFNTPSVREIQHRQRSTSVQRRRLVLEVDPLGHTDENRLSDASHSLETPVPSKAALTSTSISMATSSQRKQRGFKPYKENEGRTENHQLADATTTSFSKTCSRPDTPSVTGLGRMATSSRFRVTPQRLANHIPTAATKQLQSSGLSLPASFDVGSSEEYTSISTPSSPNQADNNHNLENTKWSVPDIRCSMPEADMLPTVSGRLAEKFCNKTNVFGSGDSSKFSASPCSRSLNMPLSGCVLSSFDSVKGNEHPTSTVSRSHTNFVNMLPPVPPSAKVGMDARKGKKVSSHQENVHCFRLLHNRYLQWRYANAKAEASLIAQQREAERTLCFLGVKISELYNSVERKHQELGLLQRTKALSTILDGQIPYLDEWSVLEGDYSNSLSEVINALLNASMQLPISGNIRADAKEVGEALISARKVMETIMFHVQSFMPKAEETEKMMSELANVNGGERALIEECQELLSKTYTIQVEECSLRGQLIQLNRSTKVQ